MEGNHMSRRVTGNLETNNDKWASAGPGLYLTSYPTKMIHSTARPELLHQIPALHPLDKTMGGIWAEKGPPPRDIQH